MQMDTDVHFSPLTLESCENGSEGNRQCTNYTKPEVDYFFLLYVISHGVLSDLNKHIKLRLI